MAKIFLVGILFVFAGDLEAQLLLYGGENTGPLNFDADASTVQAAFAGMSSVTSGTVTFTTGKTSACTNDGSNIMTFAFTGDGFEMPCSLGIHVADVASRLPCASPLFLWARERGGSAYHSGVGGEEAQGGGSVPMLPPELKPLLGKSPLPLLSMFLPMSVMIPGPLTVKPMG